MGIDRTREEDTGMNFEIGQRVRIIGPTKYGYEVHIGKCFVIGDKELHGEYSTPGCHHAWPASSLELVEPEYVADEPPTAHMLAALQRQCEKNDARIDFVLKDRSIAIDELESRAVGRFEEIEKRLQALEGKAPEATSAQEREDTDYKLYGVICKKPGLGVYELVKELGWSSDKAYGSIRRLMRDGWVMAVRDGRSALKIMPVKWHEFLTPEEIEEFKKGDFA